MNENIKKVLLISSLLLMVMAGCGSNGNNGITGTNGTNGANGINAASIPVLTSVAFDNTGVMLAWSQPYGVTNYKIYSATTSGGPFSALGTTTTTHYLIKDLTRGLTYYFVVTSVLGSEESPYSNTVSFRPYVKYTYTVGSYPYGIAIDALGNVWVANRGSNTVSEISSTTSTPQTTTIAVGTSPFGVAIDHRGNVWVTNSNSISEISGNTATTPTTGFSRAVAIAIDSAGNLWVSDFNTSLLTELDPSGAVQRVFPVCSSPQPVAIDALGNVWIGSWGGGAISEVTAQFTGYTYNLGYDSVGLAVDQSGNIWASDYGTYDVYEISYITATPVISTVISSMASPAGIAIDASGNVWIVDYVNNNVTELSPAGAQVATYPVGSSPVGLAIDASGNVWVTNYGDRTVSEIVGVAQGPQYFPCQYSTAVGNTCPQFQGGGNWSWP
ncbi:MAG: hypothetical protein M1591_02795 [Deltaproteobacteria bacterium]|nr:hypothetical protein [Deltaproteobacteria bacterium]